MVSRKARKKPRRKKRLSRQARLWIQTGRGRAMPLGQRRKGHLVRRQPEAPFVVERKDPEDK